MITVTLQQIKNAYPCEDGWKKVLKANGGVDADMDKPFALSSILDSNDLDDTLWVIYNVQELYKFDDAFREFSCWCALQNIKKIAKYCSNTDYDIIIEWLETHNPEIRSAARSAAWSAAESASESAAWSAARSAARSAAEYAAWSAARSAAEYAARSAAEYAARSAAEYAAWSAAESASESAARSAAWSAARSAARSAQKEKLREILNNHVEKI